ncbi:MAG: hypothetical protein IH612_19865, partial [Desulfofustis sp.]|nr:hypothetical protein [Desulfofustis sp.]
MTTLSFDDFRIDLARCLRRNRINRRQALWLIGVGTLCPGTLSLQGCATSPVTGES